MRTKKTTLTCCVAILIILLSVSWNKNDDFQKVSGYTAYDAIFSTQHASEDLFFYDDPMYDEFDWVYNAGKPGSVPPADDVRVQRIPGDDHHLLVMALYTKASFTDKIIIINNGGEDVVLRDDGLENDKVDGDGVYTAKIFTDVKQFRKQAAAMLKETIKNNWQPLFVDREFRYSQACEANPYSEGGFDRNEAVSIANLTAAANTGTSTSKPIDKIRKNSIFITDLSVVEDPTRTWNSCNQTGNVNGAWTFKTLMKELATRVPSQPASDQVVSDFVKKWLNTWTTQRVINGDTVAARALVKDKILTPWLNKSRDAGNPTGFLDMRFAPFKLTAIVNRFDLRERVRGIPTGEGRMIFCLINSDCAGAENFTLIFEYGINKPDMCDSLVSWARQWYNLKDLTFGSAEYLSALQGITDQFTKCGTNPNRAHQSSINAVRTNERALANTDPPRWEFREFGLNGTSHALAPRTLSRAPADKYNVQVDNEDVRRMVKFVNENAASIDIEDYDIPTEFEGASFLAGKVTILDTPVGMPTQPYHWDGSPIKNTEAFIKATKTRHTFSRNVCSGCHAGEVQTFFTHVDPVFFGTEATLSGFVSGKAGRGGAIDSDGDPNNDNFKVKDAANRGNGTDRFHSFNEIKRRAMDLKQVVENGCGTAFSLRNELMFHPTGAVH